jgi:hypothetical protein
MGERWPKRRLEGWRRPGRRSLGCGGRGGGGRGAADGVEAGERRAGGWRLRHSGPAGDARGRRPGRQSLDAVGGRRVAGAQVRSGGDRHAGHGGTDLSRVREREGQGRAAFFWIRQ